MEIPESNLSCFAETGNALQCSGWGKKNDNLMIMKHLSLSRVTEQSQHQRQNW